jgi:hypothetical protein
MEQGLSGRDIHCITVTARQKLIAAGLSEVFMNDNGAWREASNGLRVNKIRSLCADKQDRLYAATSKGIYTFDLRRPSVFFETDKTNSRTPEEGRKTNNPSIALIQKAAIEYAEVHNEKIKTWRSQAAKRALFPTVSVGVDRDRNRSTSSNTWGTYGSNGSPGKCFIGPEDSSADNNENWSVSLSWDLGDLVWNDAQTAIDVRSKLMVELRGQILDEVTKLYFERLRLIREIDELGIEERKKRSDKELKVQEVTAMLDGLTGGMFSRGQE